MIKTKARRLRLPRICVLAAVAGLAALSVSAPSQAAVPDRFGFVLYAGTVVPSGTYPAATTVTMTSTGRYTIDFVGQAASQGVAHVTAINPAPHFCQINSITPSGPDELVRVSCVKPGGAPDPTNFSAIFSSSTGPAGPGYYGYVDSTATGALVSSYNSVGATNVVTHTGTGTWTVLMPGLSTSAPNAGSIQLTAVQPQIPAMCVANTWMSSSSGQSVAVNCYNASGNLFDTEFTLTYQYKRALYGGVAPPNFFGYNMYLPPTAPPLTNFNSQIGSNPVIPLSTPPITVTFPQLAVKPDDVQVSAYETSAGAEFCTLTNPWSVSGVNTVVKSVVCYNFAGAIIDSDFLVSDNSRN